MKRSGIRAAVLAAGITVLGGGCRDIERVESFSVPNFLVVRPERPLADVPVPVGFTYKESGSYIFNGNFRVAKLQYRGTPHIERCVDFFKEQMPLSRWMLIREAGVDERVVTFRNESEEMLIRLDRSAGITALEIEIKPRST